MKSKFTRYRNLIKRPLREVQNRLHLSTDELYKLLKVWLDQGLISPKNPHLNEIKRIKKREANKEIQQKNEEDYLSYQYMRQEGYSIEDISLTLERDIDKIERYERRWYHELLKKVNKEASIDEIHKETGIPVLILKELQETEKRRQEEVELQKQKQIKNNIAYANNYFPLITERPQDVLIFDLEGVQRPDEILEIAIIDINGEVKLNTLVRPTHPIGYHISQLTGITDSMAKKGIGLYQALREFKKIADGKLLFSWGGEYDRVLLNSAMKRTGIHINCEFIDAQKIYSGIHESNNLIALYKAADEVDQSHRALDDCYMLLDVIEDLEDINQKSGNNNE